MIKNMDEYFKRNDNDKLVLISDGVEYKVTFATIKEIDYFYQYPNINDIEKGWTTPKKRLVSDISDSLPK